MKQFKAMKVLITMLSLLSAFSCQAQTKPVTTTTTKYTYTANPSDPNDLTAMYFNKNAAIDKEVEALYAKMTVQERAAQMIMIASGETMGFPYETYVKPLLENKTVANVIFLKEKTTAFKKQAAALDQNTIAGLTPLYACDCEPSLLHYKMTDKPKMTPTLQLKDTIAIKNSVDSIHAIMKDIGILINFAP